MHDPLLHGVSTDISRPEDTPFGVRLNIARVSGYDYQIDDAGNAVLDDNGNTIPTGLLSLELLDHSGTPEKVPFLVSAAGNSMFVGGLPELGSMCVIGFRQGMRPVVLGFLPMGLHRLISTRKSVPYLEPGEYLLQGSATVPSGDVGNNIFNAASVKFDKYGRILISVQGYEVTIGGALQSEYTDAVTALLDPITNERIWVRSVIAGNALDSRVDVKGNIIVRSLRSLYAIFQGLFRIQVSARVDLLSMLGFSVLNGEGTGIDVDGTGSLNLLSQKGQVNLTAYANYTEKVGSHKSVMVNGNLSEVVGSGDRNEVVSGRKTESVGGDRKVSILGDDSEEVKRGISRKSGLDWIEQCGSVRSIDADKRIEIGGPSAVDKLLKGTTFRTAQQTMDQTLQSCLTQQAQTFGAEASAWSAAAAAFAASAAAFTNIGAVYPPAAAGAAAAVTANTTAASQAVTAGVQAGLAATQCGTASAAVSTFEAGDSTYLSPKHTVY